MQLKVFLGPASMNLLNLAAGLTLAVIAQASLAAPPSAHDLHAAQCVAALDVLTRSLAAQVKSGKEDARPALLSWLESGTAFVGEVYLRGQSNEAAARKLADDALEAQKSLSEAQLAERQRACADEGARLLASSNGLERAVVKRLARKRMERLLAG
jgi:hypothetical protein